MRDHAPSPGPVVGRAQQTEISFGQALRVYAKIALWSFGGPAGQIAVMHRVLVEEKRWLSEERFLHGLNFCMLLPGPEAQQLVTYVGWLLHGVRGGLAAGWLFVLPGFVSILLLSIAYVAWQQTVGLAALSYGLKAAVLALVVEALLRIARRALRRRWHWFLAGASFCAIYFVHVPYPLIIVAAAVLGWLGERWLPPVGSQAAATTARAASAESSATQTPILDRIVDGAVRPNPLRTLATAGLWAGLWLGPVGLLYAALGGAHRLTQIGAFFSQTAAVTFGGAYSVLAYVQQHAVHDLGWLSAAEMLDGLGMAETTPGPLIQVLQFVGFLAGYRTPGAANPWATALLASCLTTWVTFAPSFLWIFSGAPYLELLRQSKPIKAALTGITAAVVGVVLNLTVTFVLQVLFGEVATQSWHGLHYPQFAWSHFDPLAAGLAVVGLVGALRWKWNMFLTLGLPTALGCASYLLRQ